MRKRTEIWEKLAVHGRFTFDVKARINHKDYLQISAPQIDRSLMPSPLSVGNCIAATLHLSVLTEDVIPPKSPIVILGRVADGETCSEWLEFGTFYIDQRDTSFEGLVTFDCYDAMLKANQPYLTGLSVAGDWPKSMKTVVEEIALRLGVGIDPRTKIKTGSDYIAPYPDGQTMAQVLGWIGGCHGGNWIITEENLLRLVPVVSAPNETFHIIDDDYNKISTAEGHLLAYKNQQMFSHVLPVQDETIPESMIPRTYYITDENGSRVIVYENGQPCFLVWDDEEKTVLTKPFPEGLINVPVVCGQITTGAWVTVTGVALSGTNGQSYTAGNSSGIVLTVEGNPYATQQICNDLYGAFDGLVYLPFTATKALYDPAVELGDQVKIGDMVNSVICSAKLTLDHNFRADLSAPNSEELSEEYPYISDLKGLQQTTKELSAAISAASEELAGKVNDADLAEEIQRAGEAEAALGQKIGEEENRATTAEEAIHTQIQSLGNTVGQMQTRLSGLTATTVQQTADIEIVQNKIADLESAITAIQNRLTAIESKLQ